MTYNGEKERQPGTAFLARTAALFDEQQQSIARHADSLIARLMVCQWAFGVALAFWMSPRTWAANYSQIHIHVWAAIFLGGMVTSVPVILAAKHPGAVVTRHTIAIGQMLMSSLLIHLTGGRIETHFHVFGSLAIIAFYRDWKVMLSATTVVTVDHLLRGIFWPQSVFGVLTSSPWRAFEHAGWVGFEVTFLLLSIRKSRQEMMLVAERQAGLEELNARIEQTVAERTKDLSAEMENHRATIKRLEFKRELLATLMENSPDHIYFKDLDSRFIRCSQTLAEKFGCRRMEEVVGKSDADFFGVERAREALADEQEIIRTGKPLLGKIEHENSQNPGRETWALTNKLPFRNEQGKIIGTFGISKDITEIKKAEHERLGMESQLQQSQKMEAVGRLAGGVAHDFNNLLTVIGGYCSLCLNQIDEGSPLNKCIQEIQKASDRAAALTRQLLAFSRKQVLQPRVLQLNDVVQNMEKMLRRLIGEDIELSTYLGKGLGNIKADPTQIEQVVMNLVVNARDAMPRGGKLTIGTSNVTIDTVTRFRNRTLEPGEYVCLAISDNGMGMSEDTKSHLFEPFFTTKGQGKGTGLGLATCHGIISQSGGDIRVYSELNSGTTFKIHFPRTEAAPDSAVVIEPKNLPSGSESILVVEDEPSVRRLAVFILRERGYQVREANDAFEALELIRKNPNFDLILTDVIMPQMSGKELLDEIKVQRPQIRFLLMSGYTDDALAHHGVLDDGLHFLEKPFPPSRLAYKVREVLDSPLVSPAIAPATQPARTT